MARIAFAGDPACTELICAPPLELELRNTPTKACLTVLPAMISLAIRATVLDGIANPTPAFEPEFVWIWSFSPSR